MIIYLTEEFSGEISNKFDFIGKYDERLKQAFSNKSYGNDLDVIYIGLFCMSPRFADFFKPRKPKYQTERRLYIHQGVEVDREGKSLSYDLRMDYETYLHAADIKPVLAMDIINSTDTISSIKRIKDFDLSVFKSDFEVFFKSQGWL